MAFTLLNQLTVDTLTFDNIEAARISPRLTLTSHPVEFGVEVSDHVQSQPLTISVRGRLTETPLVIPAPARVELALAFFERNEGQLMQVTTRRGIFRDMVVLQYDWSIEPRREIIFDIVLRKVRIALSVSVAIPARLPAPPLQGGAASAVDAGVQPPVPVPPPAGPTSVAAALGSFLLPV